MMDLDDLDTLVAHADPALDAPIPPGSSAQAHWRYVQLTAHFTGRVHHRRHLIVAAGMAATVTGALALLIVSVVPGPGGPGSAAAAVLEDAATAAGRQNMQLAPGQFLFTETESSDEVTLYDAEEKSGEMVRVAKARFTETDQAWTNADGVGHVLRTDGAVQFPSAADQAAWNASPSGPSMLRQIALSGEDGGRAGPEQPLLNVSALPTDPNALAAVIADGAMHTNVGLIPAGPNATFERAATLLVGPTAGMTSAIASALFQVLARQPGVRLLGNVTDHTGQQGKGVVLTTADGTNVSEVVVDPDTGSLLEARFASPGRTLRGGRGVCIRPVTPSRLKPSCTHAVGASVTAPVWTDVVSTGVVGSDTATLPPAGQTPLTIMSVPGVPTGLVAIAANNHVRLSWTAPADAGAGPVTSYVVYEYTGQSGSSGPAAVYDTHSAATDYLWSAPGAGATSSTFTVRAVNDDGYGPASEPARPQPRH